MKREDDIIYRTLYRTSQYKRKEKRSYSLEQRNIEKENNDKENSNNKEYIKTENKKKKINGKNSKKLGITVEKTDDIRYNKNNKKLEERELTTKSGSKYGKNNDNNLKCEEEERTVDFYVIDSDEEIVMGNPYKKKLI